MSSLIEIGKIVNTHGIRGEVKIAPWCDDPSMFCELSYFYADGVKCEITRARVHKNSVIAELAGVDGINAANAMRNKIITIEREVLGGLDEGVYYICDLIGVEVTTEDGQVLGIIEDVIQTGSNDVYWLKRTEETPAAREPDTALVKTREKAAPPLLIPALKDVILNVDIEEKTMTVRLPEGLLD